MDCCRNEVLVPELCMDDDTEEQGGVDVITSFIRGCIDGGSITATSSSSSLSLS